MGVSDKEFQALLGAANPEGEVAPSTNKPAVSDEEFKSLLGTQGEAQPKETPTTPKAVSDDEFASLLGVDSKSKVSDNEFNSLLGQKSSTVGQAVGIGAIEGIGTGITSNIYHALQASHPEAAEIVHEAISNVTGPVTETIKQLMGQNPSDTYQTLTGLYGDKFLSPETTDQQRRDMIISSTDQWKKSLVNDYYAGVDTSNHPYFNKTGQMLSGMVTDPTMMLAPEVNGATALVRIGQVAGFGARLGAAQGASDVLATIGVPTTQEQSLDAAAHVAVSTVLGAVIGAGIHTAIGEPLLKLTGTLQAKKLSGELVTPEEIAASLGGAPRALPEASTGLPLGKGIQDFELPQVTPEHQKIADNLNETFGLGKGPEEARTDQLVESALGQTNKSEAQIQLEYVQAKAGEDFKTPAEMMKAADAYYQDLIAKQELPKSVDIQTNTPVYMDNPTIKETRGGEDRYHGTRSSIDRLSDDYALNGDNRNIYGQGFYTTDAADISLGYAGYGKRGQVGNVYDVKENNKDIKLFDMEAPLSDRVKTVLKDTGISDEIDTTGLKNLREVFDEFRGESQSLGYSRDAVQSFFDSVRDNLEQQGYSGYQHVGGKKTNNPAHTVKIYWSPEKDVSISLKNKNNLFDIPESYKRSTDIAMKRSADVTYKGVTDNKNTRPDPFANVEDFVLNDPYREELHQTLLAQPELTENILKSTGQDYSMAMSMGRSKEYLAIEAVKNGDILLNSEMGQRLHPIDNGLGLNQTSDPHGGNASAFQERPTNGDGGGGLPPDEPPLGEGPFDRPDPMSTKIRTDYLDSKSMTFFESFSRTRKVWEKTGAPGIQAYDMWRNTQENISMAQGKWMGQFYNIMDENNLLYGRSSVTNIRKAVNGMDDEEIVKGLLNKTYDGPVTKGQLRAAQQMRQMFDTHVGDWVQSKLMTPERGAELIKNARENGYFPRVADKPFLRTEEGQEKFRKAMANVEYGNETTAKKVVEAIVGDKRLLRKRNAIEKIPDSGEVGVDGKVIKGTEKYKVVPEIYNFLWKRQTNVGDAQLSAHMEHERVLPPELEKALQPFQVRGLEHAMKTYSFDTNTRLEYAKIWGPNNENFVELFNKMHDINPVAAENFHQSYWTQLGDPKAWNVQTMLMAPRWASNASGAARSLTVFKLTLAPIKNMVQNPIMSATHFAKTTYVPILNRKGVVNPYQGLMTFFKGNFKGLAGEVGIGEASDVARRFGSSIEHAYAGMAGKLSDNATIGKALGYVPLVGDLLKDPGTWLKLNTFEKTEDIQRSQGTQVGIQYTYYLLQNLKKQEALLAEGKIKPIKVERTRAALEEVGIPRSTTIDNVTIENMRNSSWLIAHANEVNTQFIGKAGQRLSNEFNFTNSVADRPLFANSFMGKLLSSLHRFSYGTSAFLVDNVWQPLVKDQNVLPFMMYFGVGTAAGMKVMDGYRWLAGDTKEKTLTKRVFDAFGAVASLGLPQDILSSTTYGKYAPLAAVAGPALTTPSTIAASFGQLYNQAAYQNKFDSTPLVREFLGDVALPFNKQMKLDLSVKNRDIFNAKFEATQGQDVFGNQKIEKAPFEQ